MSNFDSDNKIPPKTNLKHLKWKSIQTDLKSALSDWSESAPKDPQKTPEELQLDKVKSMIENIKEKLNQF